MLDELQFDSKEKPRIVHRIDKETSGLLIIARTYKSSVYFSKEFNKKKIEKFYIAILNGIPKKNEGRMVNQIKDDKNKTSITRYIILRKIEKKFSFILLTRLYFSLLNFELFRFNLWPKTSDIK